MRVVPFIISSLLTTGLVVALNTPLPLSTGKTPKLGYFLSPQQGFWQNAEPVNVDFNEDLQFQGVKGKVDVYFDERLVPHVYAENEGDAYFVQGYLHARFRLWQMDFQTYAAGGRLSEIMGAKRGTTDFLKIDQFFRRVGMVLGAEKSLVEMEANPITKSSMDAYTAGVNAYIENLKPSEIPLEYKLLDYQPEKWTNLKSALFLKYMSWDLAGAEWDFEMKNAVKALGSQLFEQLYPTIQDTLDPIIPKGTAFEPPAINVKAPADADSVYYSNQPKDSGVVAFTEPRPDEANGSNNWAVGGSKTKSGRPILCNDPHLGLNLPSLWYEIQISTPNFNAYGASFPGTPSVIIGFNDSCAWGFTNAMRDVRDFYEITFKDSTMQSYWFNGNWTPTEFREEVIKIKGEPDKVEKIAMTVFGPVMYDRSFENRSKDGKYYACRWKAHDASNELLTFNRLNHAKNYYDYVEAISTFQCPGQNMLFASKSGDIAIRQQGQFPAKWRRQGDFPMPGNDSSYMWQGLIPLKENPQMVNPERGFVSSANQLPVDATYPYYMGGSYPPYRGLIINRKLAAMSNITAADMQLLQTDNYNVFAEMARPVLLKHLDALSLSAEEKKYVDVMRNWNLRNDIGETGISVFKALWDSLEIEIYEDEITQAKLLMKWPDESTLLEGLLKNDSTYTFADNITTFQKETVADQIKRAIAKAAPALAKLEKEGKLAWGKCKDSGIQHLTKVPALSRLHLPIGGGEHIINATKQYHGPSWRMIVHLTDNIEAYGVYPGGQSGNPGSKYYDTFVDSWAAGKYYPLLFVDKKTAKQPGRMKWFMTFTHT